MNPRAHLGDFQLETPTVKGNRTKLIIAAAANAFKNQPKEVDREAYKRAEK